MKWLLWTATLSRVVLIPVFLYLGATAQALGRAGDGGNAYRYAALATIVLMGVTDLLDGWIARRWRLVTPAGAVADAVADKLVQVALVAFFALSVGPAFRAIPLWFLLLVFGRDLVLLVGVLMLRFRYGPLEVVHRWHGRTASLLVHGVVFGAALRLPTGPLTALMLLTGGLSLYSATIYALDGAAQGRARAGDPS